MQSPPDYIFRKVRLKCIQGDLTETVVNDNGFFLSVKLDKKRMRTRTLTSTNGDLLNLEDGPEPNLFQFCSEINEVRTAATNAEVPLVCKPLCFVRWSNHIADSAKPSSANRPPKRPSSSTNESLQKRMGLSLGNPL